MFPLVISELLGLLVQILIVDDKYSVHTNENLRQPIQRQTNSFSQKQYTFSQFFASVC